MRTQIQSHQTKAKQHALTEQTPESLHLGRTEAGETGEGRATLLLNTETGNNVVGMQYPIITKRYGDIGVPLYICTSGCNSVVSGLAALSTHPI